MYVLEKKKCNFYFVLKASKCVYVNYAKCLYTCKLIRKNAHDLKT